MKNRNGRSRSWHHVARHPSTLLPALAVGFILLVVPGPAGAGPTIQCGPSWMTVPSSTALKDPRSIGALASDDVWAVGAALPTPGVVRTGAEHWDGSAWTLFPTPNPGQGENSFNAVAPIASDDAWAVGYQQPTKKTSSAFRTLASHWDGVSWSSVSPPNATVDSNSLAGVAAISTHNVWAVGYYYSGAARKTLAEHYNGTDWRIVPTPSPGGAYDSGLVGVSAVSSDNIWAIGYQSQGLGYTGLIEHYDGTSWTVVPAATPPGAVEYVLTAVYAESRQNVWAVGYQIVGPDHQGLTEHYDGSDWTVVPSANGDDGYVTILRGVYASAKDAWAVGFQYAYSRGQYRSYSEHYDGNSWSTVPLEIESSHNKSEAYSVAEVPGSNQVWAGSRTADMELYCSPSSTPTSPPATPSEPSGSPSRVSAAPLNGTPSTRASPLAVPGTVLAKPIPLGPAVNVRAEDVASQAGIAQTSRTHGAVAADFNNDGHTDIFLGLHNEHPAKLYINDGNGHFNEIDAGTFVHRDRHGCTAADANGDGLLDIFCNTGADRGTEGKKNELWIQQPDHTFLYRAPEFGVMAPLDRGRLSAFIDIDQDGMPDIFTTDFRDRADGMPSPDRIYINKNGTSYRLAPEYGLEQNISGGSISVGDYNNDGYPDLLVDTQSGLKLFKNSSGKSFVDVTAAVKLEHSAQDDQFGDFNGDGKLDVAEANPHNVEVFLQQGNGTFKKVFATPVQAGFAVAPGDVNRDGRLDMYVQEGSDDTTKNAPDIVLINDGSGTSFTSMSVPSTSQGVADAVTPIDYDGNGMMDFIVQNGGADKEGPVQLIAFFPA